MASTSPASLLRLAVRMRFRRWSETFTESSATALIPRAIVSRVTSCTAPSRSSIRNGRRCRSRCAGDATFDAVRVGRVRGVVAHLGGMPCLARRSSRETLCVLDVGGRDGFSDAGA